MAPRATICSVWVVGCRVTLLTDNDGVTLHLTAYTLQVVPLGAIEQTQP